MPPIPTPPQHQVYILPSPPFRRRQSSTTSPGSPTLSNTYFPFPSSTPSPSSPLTPGTSYTTTPNTSPLYSHQERYKQTARRPSYLAGHTSHISCAKCKAELALSSQIISKGFTGRHGRAYLVSPESMSAMFAKARRTSSISSSRVGSVLPQSPPPPPRRRSSALATALAYTFSFASSSSSSSSATSPASCTSSQLTSQHHTPSPPPSLPNTTLHAPTQRHLVTGLHTVADISCSICNAVIGWKYLHADEESQKYKEGMYILETGRVVGGVVWDEGERDDDDDGDGCAGRGDVVVHDGSGRNDQQSQEDASKTGESAGKGKAKRINAATTTTSTICTPSSSSTNNNNRRRQWEHTPVFGMDSEESDDDNDDDNECNDTQDDDDEDEDEILFDSQDEDECDDLFAGVWNADVVRQRRMSRR